MGGVVRQALRRLPNGSASAVVQAWFIDDRHIFLRPDIVEPFLRAFDEELAAVGATRGRISMGHDIKSTARLHVASDDTAAARQGWGSAWVRDTCQILADADPTLVLGAEVGIQGIETSRFLRVLARASELHQALDCCEDPGVELVFQQKCADVSFACISWDQLGTVSHQMRYIIVTEC